MVKKRAKIQEKYRILKDRQLLQTFSLFIFLVIGLNLLFRIPNPILDKVWYLVVLTTNASAWLIKLAGIKMSVIGNKIVLPSRTLLVNAECTAIYLMILYISFLAVYPADWLKKLLGAIGGLIIIFFANIFRLLITAWVSEYKPLYFEYFHDYTWQVFFIILVILLWIIWIEKVVGYERKTAVYH